MNDISLLHLSDLHLMLSADGANLRNALLSEAEARFASLPEGRKLLVLTGDFHNFGKDYGLAKEFLPRLFEKMGLVPAQDVFMVPGNHDLDASTKGCFCRNAMINTLRGDPERIAREPEVVRELLPYYDAYLALARELGVYSEEDCQNRVPVSVHVRTWRDTLHLLHLNTTLIADGTEKTNQLADVLSAVSEGIQAQLGDGKPCLALGHNHIYDLHKSQWSKGLRGAFDFGGVSAYLCGDRHQTDEECRERTMWLGTADDAPKIPIVCAPRGSADEGDKSSESGFLLHVWDPSADEVRWEARLWRSNEPRCFMTAKTSSYGMKRGTGAGAPPVQTEDLGRAVKVLDAETVAAQAKACGPNDIAAFYRVTDRYEVMLRALAGGNAIARDDEVTRLAALLEQGAVLLAGNGGMGKTTLLLMTAIRWAEEGGVAVWLKFSELGRSFDAAAARRLARTLAQWAENGRRVLLCLDSPGWNWDALEALRRAWLDQPLTLGQTTERGGCVRLALAERSARLTHGQKHLSLWLDGAPVAELRRSGDQRPPSPLGERKTVILTEGEYFRRKLLLSTTNTYKTAGALSRCSPRALMELVDEALKEYNAPLVSLVELIYRALLPKLRGLTPEGGVVLDWEEWGRVLRERFELSQRDDFELYGALALFRLLGAPMPVPLFCAQFGLDEGSLVSLLRAWRFSKKTGAIEPVVYTEGRRYGDWATLEPKHDEIAEVFFLLRKDEDEAYDRSAADRLLLAFLEHMSEPEVEYLLQGMAERENMRRLKQRGAVRVGYRVCAELLCDRMRRGTLNLSDEGRINLCLCLLWSNGGERLVKWDEDIQALLVETAPEPDGDRLLSILHTEWGIWLSKNRRESEAEEKFRAVNRADKTQLHSRTELGKLLAKRTGDKEAQREAEELFRDVFRIDPRNIPCRTELGKLLAKRTGDKEALHKAEELFRDVIRIDPRNIPCRTELGRLLAKRTGDEKALREAEELFREAIKLDKRQLHPRTELGKLLAKRTGDKEAQREAEELFREAMQIDPNHIHSRTELGKLLAKRTGDKEALREAEELFREAIDLDNRQLAPRHELGRLLERTGRERGEIEKLREAKSLYQEILALDKNHNGAKAGLERLADVE